MKNWKKENGIAVARIQERAVAMLVVAHFPKRATATSD